MVPTHYLDKLYQIYFNCDICVLFRREQYFNRTWKFTGHLCGNKIGPTAKYSFDVGEILQENLQQIICKSRQKCLIGITLTLWPK